MEVTDSKGVKHEVVPQYFLEQTEEPMPDVTAFFDVLKEERRVFLERRLKYGSHLDKAQRFPEYHSTAIYQKCVRLITMYEHGDELDRDTLLDLAAYCAMLISTRGDSHEH